MSSAALLLLACTGREEPALTPDIEDQVYREVGELSLTLDLWIPEGEGPHPAILLVHGGGFTEGDKLDGGVRVWADDARARGWLVIAPNYRLTTEQVGFPAPAQDVRCALRWAWAEAPASLSLSLVGTSSGATLGALAVLADLEEEGCPWPAAPEPLEAMVFYYGVHDWPRLVDQRPSMFSSEVNFVGSECLHPDERSTLCQTASPAAWVRADQPPTLLLHSEDDGLVPVGQAEVMQEALEEVGAEVERIEVDGLQHGWAGRGDAAANGLREEVFNWLTNK